MANLVNLEQVTKSYGTRTLLDAVSLGIDERSRIGVVGRNGGGKTTLVRLLAQVEQPDAGRVTHTGGLQVALLSQQAPLPRGATVRSVVLGEMAEHEWAADAALRGIVEGLGLLDLPNGLESVVDTLSGGERRRAALASMLVSQPGLLILDEPTNHLDVEGIAWLASHLKTWRGSLVVVTHDRWFLDEVCDTTWEVVDGAVNSYEGGYSAYVLARAERDRIASVNEDRRQNLMRKELAWLRRGPPARTSKPRFRIDAANALIADEPPARDSVELQKFAMARLGKTVYDAEDVTVAIPGGRTLLDHVTWRVGPGDRFGVVGVNGAGKTTLLRLLEGSRAPDSGVVKVGQTVKLAYLSQEVTELDPSLRVLEAVEDVAKVIELGKGRQMTASQLLERFGFTGQRQWTRVGELSGGERRRLQLMRLLLTEPNVLMLDEPTNDLDIDTLTALEDLLDSWPGVLLVVSHDRYFLERVTDRTVALLGDGHLVELPGGVEDYLERRQAVRAAAGPGAKAAAPAKPAGDTRAARKEMSRLERQIQKFDKDEAALHAKMAAQASDFAAVTALDAQLRTLRAERTVAEEAWMELAESTD
ncbi:MAG: transport system ATP-binding/permease protein [Frankiales bacterium]|jgi:ATP-binding cassette subfamily F protein uup|nr:transport system ATP-binding/permease protein [Frankiales bacterium]MDX6213324.1 transport system ATP-binding/permease protein [Frankiales bacterium]